MASFRIAAALAGVCLLALTPLCAQAEPIRTGAYRAPRTAHGQPDLQGIWTNISMTQLERQAGAPLTFATRAEEAAFEASALEAWKAKEAAGLGMGLSEWHTQNPMARIGGRLRTSWIVSPADGRLPWRPEALARLRAMTDASLNGLSEGPEARTPMDRCLVGGLDAAGPPMLNPPVAAAKQIVQTATEVAILSEMNHDVRIVRLNTRERLPATVHPWMGDSIGWWEGETLVVETTNFHPQEAYRVYFLISPDARVTERFTRVSPDELLYAFEVDDPVNFTQVWRAEMPFIAEKGPIYEFACHEGNYAMTGILAGARREEAEARARAQGAAR